jgi:hypothetical protein
MKWLSALLLVGLLVAGCKSQAPMADPFFGRTTIPPPATGAVGRAADPCYQPPPLVQTPPQAPAGCQQPIVQVPAQTPSSSPPAALQVPAPATTQPPTQMPAQPAPGQPLGQALGPSPTAAPSSAPPALAPRPTSTLPGGSTAPAPTYPAAPPPTAPSPASPTTAPGPSSPYSPPGGSFNYRGASTQGGVPLVPSQPEGRVAIPASSTLSVARTETSTAADDRMPRPLDETLTQGSSAVRKPIVRTLQPRGSDNATDRPIDITDLPKTPASGL